MNFALATATESGVYTPTPSEQMYVPLLTAFNHFNVELFNGKLPDCLVTIRARGRTQGFYHPKRFAALKDRATVDEIAMNPAYFPTRSLKDIASTFAHEMAHHAQEHFGTPPRNGYHDREWAQIMREIGLMPSTTGAVDGKQTGYRVSHYIVEGGPFDLSFERLAASGWQIGWGDAPPPSSSLDGNTEGAPQGPKPTRGKYVCPGGCGLVMYGPRHNVQVRCEPCDRRLVKVDHS
jgi:predicted SprT family Zn-dependent metalloprotease